MSIGIVNQLYRYRSKQFADLYFSSVALDPKPDTHRQFVDLYPHTSDCWALLVPISKHRLTFAQNVIQRPIMHVIIVTLVVLMLFRLQRRLEPVSDAVLLTFGALLAQLNVPKPRRCSDYIWTVCTLLGAIFATIVLSGTIFGIMMHIKYAPEIDTFHQLIESNLVICGKHVGLDDYYMFEEYVFFFDDIIINECCVLFQSWFFIFQSQ